MGFANVEHEESEHDMGEKTPIKQREVPNQQCTEEQIDCDDIIYTM